MSLDSLLTQTCEIHRWSRARGADFTLDEGGYTRVASDVPCCVQEKSGRIKITGGGQVAEFTSVGYFLPDVDVRPTAGGGTQLDDLIILSTGARYYVKGVTDQTGRNFMKTVYLEKRD